MSIKESEVDSILNNWFGESPENSDHEEKILKLVYDPLRKIERERDDLREKVKRLEGQVSDMGWQINPDRMGQ